MNKFSKYDSFKNKTDRNKNKSKQDDDKFFKFKNMSKLIVNKIDNILSNTSNPSEYDYKYSDNIKNIIPFIEKPKEDKPKIDKKKAFLTNVDLMANEESNQYMNEKNKKIREILDNVDDIEVDPEFKVDDPGLPPEFKKDILDMKMLFSEIQSHERDYKYEFDELQFLIKMTDRTHNSVKRHIKSVSNMIGINFESASPIDIQADELRNRPKNLNLIADKISNIQDKVLSFYDEFKK